MAGAEYLQKKFGKRRVKKALAYFEKWGTGSLAVSSAVPFPFPTSALFAAAGVLNYPVRKFLHSGDSLQRSRYTVIALIAFHYGRRFITGAAPSGTILRLDPGHAGTAGGC